MCDSNLSLWKATASEQVAYPALTTSTKVDVAIIGGGYSGLSCALHLAQKGASVALLEANQVGFGGSGRNVGLVNAGLWMPPNEVESVLGKDAADTLYHALAKAPDEVFSLIDQHQIACEATRKGTLHAAVGSSGLAQIESRFLQLSSRGAPVQLLSQDEAQTRIGSSYFKGALFDPRAGTIQPLSYALGLAKAAARQGVNLYEGTKVQEIQALPSGWQLTCASGGKVIAEKVVVATNAYCQHIFPDLNRSFVPIQYSQFASQPLGEDLVQAILPHREGLWDTCTVMSSLRLDHAGRLIFGGMGGVALKAQLLAWADKRIHKLFPFLPKLSWQYAWSGKIAFSHDHLPHCHQLEEGIYSLLGYSGRGIGPGTLIGKELAHFLTDAQHQMPIEITRIQPVAFRGAKQTFYEVGAQLHHLSQLMTPS